MAITQKKSGKWLCRLQIPTSENDSAGNRKYRGLQKAFETKGAAEAWEKQQRNQYLSTGRDSTLTLIQIAEYREAKELAGAHDLRSIVKYWLEHNPVSGRVPVSQAIEAYKASKQWNVFAASTQATKSHQLGKFTGRFGSRQLTEITIAEVETYLDGYAEPVTRNNHLRTLKAFFKWCTLRGIRYLNANPIEPIETLPESFDVPEFMPLEDVRKIMDQATQHDTTFIPFLSLGFFAGLRTSEILRLEKRDFLFQDRRINLRGEVAKRKRAGKPLARLIEGLPATLWEWLEAIGFDGKIDATNYGPRRKSIYRNAGVKWFNSAARHTFATYAYAVYDAGQVRKWTGHRNSDSLLLTHYAGLEERARGELYFQIKPPYPQLPIHKPGNKYASLPQWPAPDELRARVAATSKSEVARQLGVSETAVRKHLQLLSSSD
ncbi:hypothetical protein H5P28_10080 [Ruficoccus amylovorans]|uniref:Core-binding (CB) domain-containing protein n=1 Tax=Ruficoccus amylovorans TaxID=1804625 RepID=A0A842HG48_9BACT|nr:site-specific integrase [Ruficoccus amylovorans]MBC2594606.1 hypothetical protein [Ruficoccus amylovorans]